MEAPRGLRVLLAVILIGLVLFPLVGERFYIQYATKIMILAIFAMSLDLLVGYTGLVSLGHALCYGIAGYALALALQGAHDAYLVLRGGARVQRDSADGLAQFLAGERVQLLAGQQLLVSIQSNLPGDGARGQGMVAGDHDGAHPGLA